MTREEQQAILTISLMAAFADGGKDDRERTEVKRIAESLSDSDINVSALYQDVLLKRRSLEHTVAAIATPELRQYAYEMAVCVCDADGAHVPAEKVFLDRLRAALGLDAARSETFAEQAAVVAAAPLAVTTAAEPVVPAGVSDVEMDKMILNYAILNGALGSDSRRSLPRATAGFLTSLAGFSGSA